MIFATALLIVGFCAWLTTQTLPAIVAKWSRESAIAQDRLALDERYVVVAEREIALSERQLQFEERKAEKPRAKEPMPPDLEARISGWEDDWAREDERKALEQLYADSGDWDAVRRQYSPALAHEQSDTQVV